MKPQQILNKLAKYNEVQKVELSAEEPMEVQLSAISELKDLANSAATASMRAGDGLNSVIKGLAAAKTVANQGLSKARKAIAVSKDLGIDTSEFERFEKMFSRWYDDYENSISLVQKLQNRL